MTCWYSTHMHNTCLVPSPYLQKSNTLHTGPACTPYTQQDRSLKALSSSNVSQQQIMPRYTQVRPSIIPEASVSFCHGVDGQQQKLELVTMGLLSSLLPCSVKSLHCCSYKWWKGRWKQSYHVCRYAVALITVVGSTSHWLSTALWTPRHNFCFVITTYLSLWYTEL